MSIRKKDSTLLTPYIFLGVFAVLLPIFLFITFDRVARQKTHIHERLFTRGSSLIRTFEAGTRSGMMSMAWGLRKIQNMLVETSFQPEISYIFITDETGKILAHSDPAMLGKTLDNMPDLTSLSQDPLVFSKRNMQRGEEHIFEVFKRFTPLKSRFSRHRPMAHGGKMNHVHKQPGTAHSRCFASVTPYIFVGLSMERMDRIQQRMVRRTIARGVMFFLLGGAGIVSILVFQAYRITRANLNQIQAFSDNLVRNMPTGLLAVDMAGEITAENEAARQILGEKLERPFSEMRSMAKKMAASGKVMYQEFNLVTKQNRKLRLDMTGSPLLDEEGTMIGFLFLFRDLTKVHGLEKELETTRRLAAIGKFAGGVAHEIRNPLSSIKGFASYFMKRYQDEPKDVETAAIMVQEVERINRSITQLLEFARPLAAQKEDVEIASLLDHSLRLVEHDLKEKNIASRIELRPEVTSFSLDPEHLSQILLNLYRNAIQAMEESGELSIVVALAIENNGLEITVGDDGHGIDAETLEHIFDPYFTTRSDGTGLGLAIVHRMVENLGGTIRVNSQPGKGTEFILFFPQEAVA